MQQIHISTMSGLVVNQSPNHLIDQSPNHLMFECLKKYFKSISTPMQGNWLCTLNSFCSQQKYVNCMFAYNG